MLTPLSRGRLGTFRVYRYVRHCGFDCVRQTGGSTPLVLTDDTLLPGINGDDSLAPGLKPFSPRTTLMSRIFVLQIFYLATKYYIVTIQMIPLWQSFYYLFLRIFQDCFSFCLAFKRSERNLNFFAKQKRDETHMVLLNALSESSQSKTEYQTKRLYFNSGPSNGVTDIYFCKLKHTVFFFFTGVASLLRTYHRVSRKINSFTLK